MNNRIEKIKVLLLATIAICLLIVVIQGFSPKRVRVEGGFVDISGSVRVKGSVDVDNTVGVDIKAINGNKNAFYGPSSNGSYDAIHVYTGD